MKNFTKDKKENIKFKILEKNNLIFWTTKEVKLLIYKEYNLDVPLSTVRDYVKKWICNSNRLFDEKKILLDLNEYKKIKNDVKIERGSIFLVTIDFSTIKIIRFDNNEFYFLLNFKKDYESFFKELLNLDSVVFIFFVNLSKEIMNYLKKNERSYDKNKLRIFYLKFNLTNYLASMNTPKSNKSSTQMIKEIINSDFDSLNKIQFTENLNSKNSCYKIIDFWKEVKEKKDLKNKKRRDNYKENKNTEKKCKKVDLAEKDEKFLESTSFIDELIDTDDISMDDITFSPCLDNLHTN